MNKGVLSSPFFSALFDIPFPIFYPALVNTFNGFDGFRPSPEILITSIGLAMIIITKYTLSIRKIRSRLKLLESVIESQAKEIEEKDALLNKEVIENKKDCRSISETNTNSELYNCISLIINKNILINEFKKKISEGLKLESEKQTDLRKIVKTFINGLNTGQEWAKFELEFNAVYSGFIRELKKQFPDLSNNDLTLCSLYRCQLSSKQIAEALDISLTTLKMARYRLRKKLNLTAEEDLLEFLITFASV